MKVKKTVASLCAGALAVAGAFGAAGCSLDVDSVVDKAGTKADNAIRISVETDTLNSVLHDAAIESGMTEAQAAAMAAMVPLYAEQMGVKYTPASGDEGATYSIDTTGTTKNKYYKDTVAFYPEQLVSMISEEMGDNKAEISEKVTQLEKLLGDKPMDVTWTFDFSGRTPVETNLEDVGNGKYAFTLALSARDLGELAAGNKVASDYVPKAVYARFTDAALTTSTVETDAKGGYTKTDTVSIYTPGIIENVKLGSKELGASDSVELGKEGKKTITVALNNGNSKTLKVVYDKTAPSANVKVGKTYKRGYKVTFKDKVAGVKSATLDGKKIASGKKVTKAGSHKLVVTDKAGNKASVKFKIA